MNQYASGVENEKKGLIGEKKIVVFGKRAAARKKKCEKGQRGGLHGVKNGGGTETQ